MSSLSRSNIREQLVTLIAVIAMTVPLKNVLLLGQKECIIHSKNYGYGWESTLSVR